MSDHEPDLVLIDPKELTEQEVKAVKDFLRITQSLGSIGRWIIYAIITLGAIAATAQQLKIDLFGTH